MMKAVVTESGLTCALSLYVEDELLALNVILVEYELPVFD